MPVRITRRRAAVAVMAAASLLMMFGFAALAVDTGLIFFARSQMQRTADASALAGASGVVVHQAVPRAREFASLNPVVTQPVLPNELDVTIGNWDGVANRFTPTPDEGVNDVLPNAVRVVGTRPDLGLLFAPVMGRYVTLVRRGATALVGSGHCVGIWGIECVTVAGDLITDSYDSAVGGYGPGNIRPNGDVCSCRDFVVNGGVSIRGDAMYGEGYEFIPNGTSYEVLGLIDDHTCGPPNVNIDYEAAAAENDNALIPPRTFQDRPTFTGRTLALAGADHITLLPGTYYLQGLRLEGGYIEITGPTTIYIDGNAQIGGLGLVNTTQDANNLIIYCNDPMIMWSGTATFYGAIIAPTSTFTVIGTFNAYGTVLAGCLNFNGDAVFHVDEGLVFNLFGISSVAPVLVE